MMMYLVRQRVIHTQTRDPRSKTGPGKTLTEILGPIRTDMPQKQRIPYFVKRVTFKYHGITQERLMKSPDGLTRKEILIILLVAQKSFIRLYGVMENGICQWNHIQEINIH